MWAQHLWVRVKLAMQFKNIIEDIEDDVDA
jgi:hypothetical protein